MITLQEIKHYLEEFLQIERFADYCENGVQVEGKPEVRKIATAVSASLSTIEAAVEQKADLLLVHHGLFWKGGACSISGALRKKIALLLENDLSLLAYHLPLDAHKAVGNNWLAAKEMGWRDLKPFCELDGNIIGVRGVFDPVSLQDFQTQLESYYRHPAVVAPGGPRSIASAALVSGGARKALSDAITTGVDAFITGNFDEPEWHIAHEGGIHFFAMGHSATERIGPRALGKHLSQNYDLEAVFLEIENPF